MLAGNGLGSNAHSLPDRLTPMELTPMKAHAHEAHTLQGVQSARWWVVYLDSERGLLCRVPLPATLAPDTESAARSEIRSSPGTGGGGSSGSTARSGGGHAGPTRSNASPVVVYQVCLAPEREPCPISWSLIWLFCLLHSVTGT
jgi:hypothetical protein